MWSVSRSVINRDYKRGGGDYSSLWVTARELQQVS